MTICQMQQAAVYSKNTDKPTIHDVLSTKQLTDNVSDYLVIIAKHLAAKEQDLFP